MLVPAVPAERDLDLAASRSRAASSAGASCRRSGSSIQSSYRRDVVEHRSRVDRGLHVVRAEVLRHGAGVRALIEAGVLEADRERLDLPVHARRTGRDEGAVEPAGEEHADRHVGHEARARRRPRRGGRARPRVRAWIPLPARAAREVVVALDDAAFAVRKRSSSPGASFRTFARMVRGAGMYSWRGPAPTATASIVRSQRARAGAREGAELGREDQPVTPIHAERRVVERLLAEAVAARSRSERAGSQ